MGGCEVCLSVNIFHYGYFGLHGYHTSRRKSQSLIRKSRLRLQHELTKNNLGGHVLLPSIPPLKPGMTIADVACGTGVWLLDAVDAVSDVTGHGLDINLSEVPPQAWLPEDVSFRPLNILEGLPEEYVGKYDVVNAQFASSFVRDPHIELVMANLVKMLSKPRRPR